MSHKINKLWTDSNNTKNSLDVKELIKNRIDKQYSLKKLTNIETEWQSFINAAPTFGAPEKIGGWGY